VEREPIRTGREPRGPAPPHGRREPRESGGTAGEALEESPYVGPSATWEEDRKYGEEVYVEGVTPRRTLHDDGAWQGFYEWRWRGDVKVQVWVVEKKRTHHGPLAKPHEPAEMSDENYKAFMDMLEGGLDGLRK
jgi:hypothetical protein